MEISSPDQTSLYERNVKLASTTHASSGPSGGDLMQSSLTQRQILSHALVREVMDKRKKNTVHHRVNMIANGTSLSKIPLEKSPNEFGLGIIPSNNEFASQSSQKARQIHNRLSDRRDLSQKIVDLLSSSTGSPSATPAHTTNTDRRVSISGLVSYSFNSVNARRSLGSIPDVSEEQALAAKQQQVKRRNSCSTNREMSIIRRKSNGDSTHKINLAKASVCDFTSSTDWFLHNLIQEKTKSQCIYGQSMEKLRCVKQYMGGEKTDYDNAKFIVDAIADSQKTQKKKYDRSKQKAAIDDQLELSKRRKAVSSRKVMLRQLHFTD